MPVQWFAGFEAGDTNELISLGGSVTIGAAYKRNGSYGCRIVAPQGSGTAHITLASGFNANGNPIGISRTAYTLGFGMRLTTLPETVNTWEYLLHIALSTTHRASLRLARMSGEVPTAALRLHIGVFGTAHVAQLDHLELNRWYFCELAVLFDRYIWQMDGQLVARGIASPGGSMDLAALGKRFNLASQGYTLDVDDLYTGDDGMFYGPTTRVARLNPNANGTQSDWCVCMESEE